LVVGGRAKGIDIPTSPRSRSLKNVADAKLVKYLAKH